MVAVSVIIVNWNRVDDLLRCLGCLQQQSFRDFEIIVVDNGSDDGSSAIVAEAHPDVRVLALPENVGYGRANNLGCELAQGRYIALLNNDAFPEPDWLKYMVQVLEKHPDVGFCACKILQYPATHLIDTVGDAFSIFGKALKLGFGEQDEGQYDKTRPVFGACAAAAIYRHEMLVDIGLFDDDFSPAGLEDIDLSFRAQLRGYRCRYVPEAVVYHRVAATRSRFSDEMFYLSNRNTEYVFWKNMPGLLLVFCAPLHLLHLLLALIYHAARGRAGLFLRAKCDAWRRLPAILGQRRLVRKRRVSLRYLVSILDKGIVSLRPTWMPVSNCGQEPVDN